MTIFDLLQLKYKAKIRLEQSVHLFGRCFTNTHSSLPHRASFTLGGIDEIGVLKQKQIFCKTVDRDGVEHVVTGTCIIFVGDLSFIISYQI
jgi:hypothetical protein